MQTEEYIMKSGALRLIIYFLNIIFFDGLKVIKVLHYST